MHSLLYGNWFPLVHNNLHVLFFFPRYTSIGSIHDTVPNALLSISDSCCKEKFKPAYLLSDGRLERAGRAKKFSSSINAVGNGSGSVDSHKSSLLVASVIAVGEEIL